MLKDLVEKTRSFRRFDETVPVPYDVLLACVDLARIAASGANQQGLKYYLSTDKAEGERIFATLRFAGYLKDWPGPQPGERPTAYIVILGDKTIKQHFDTDCGIAAQTVMLALTEKGFGGCMVASFRRPALIEIMDTPEHLEPILVLALGKPAEKVVLEEMKAGGSHQYYRDENDVHHVPKRPLSEVVLPNASYPKA